MQSGSKKIPAQRRLRLPMVCVAIALATALLSAGFNRAPATEITIKNSLCTPFKINPQKCTQLPVGLATICSRQGVFAGTHCYATPPVYATGGTCGAYQVHTAPTSCTYWYVRCWTFDEGVCQWTQQPGGGPIPECGKGANGYAFREARTWVEECD